MTGWAARQEFDLGVARDAPGRLTPRKASACHLFSLQGKVVTQVRTENSADHLPVMPEEALDALAISPGGIYLDATYGRGGHSHAILQALIAGGALFALDQDPEAVAQGQARFEHDPRFAIRQGNFADLEDHARGWGIAGRVDGVLMDLGVSSPQLDEAGRGFSFAQDGPLDMRMNPQAGSSAADWLAQASEREIAGVLKELGEERFARRIARAIVADRSEIPFQRTAQLSELIARVVPAREPGKHPATRAFQAIRIHINHELEALQKGLDAAVRILSPGARLVVISFHSLEDRRVKRFMRDQSGHAPRPRRGLPLPEDKAPALQRLGKAQRPTHAEIEANPRARSAVLRVAMKQDAAS